MKKFDLNRILKILKIIFLILLILTLLPRIFSKGRAAGVESDPVPDPDPGFQIVSPAYGVDGFQDSDYSFTDFFSFDNYDDLYDPQDSFFESTFSYFNNDLEASYINSYVNNGENFQIALEDGTMTFDQYVSYTKLYEICWLVLLSKLGIFTFFGVISFKAVRHFF